MVKVRKKVTLNAKRFDRTYLIDLHTRYANHNKSLACIVELGNSEANHKDLKQHRADVAEAKNADYTKEVNGYIDKSFLRKLF